MNCRVSTMYKNKMQKKSSTQAGGKNKYTNVKYCTTHLFADRPSNLKICTICSKTITADNPSEEINQDPKLYSSQRGEKGIKESK